MILTYKQVLESASTQVEKDGRWIPARPINWTCRTLRQRLYEAWMVFTGKADPYVWPQDEEPTGSGVLGELSRVSPKQRRKGA